MKPHPFRVQVKGNYPRSQVHLTWQSNNQTISHELSKRIEDYWQQEVLPGPKGRYVFNGQLCSLNNWHVENLTLFLKMARTDYKTLLYSNFINRNSESHGSFICSALGISVVIVSADNRLVLMQRSQQVGECAGMFDVIGGHVEPGTHDVDGIPNPFVGIQAEIEEEVGLTDIPVEKLICIGLLETLATRKPELIFQLNSDLPAEEIINSARKKGSTEASNFLSIKNSVDGIKQLVEGNRDNFSPSAVGSLYLFADLEW